MRGSRWALLAVAMAACGCGSSGKTSSGADGGDDSGRDTGSPGDDSGINPGSDSGSSNGDSGVTDSGATPPGPDGGMPGEDGGTLAGIPGAKIGVGTMIGSCEIFPRDNAWNVEIDGPEVQVIHTYDSRLPASTPLHPDFGDWTSTHYGIPFSVVPASQADVSTTFTLYPSESDPGPGGWVGAGVTAYPFFLGMHIEGDPSPGGTPGSLKTGQHAIVLQQGPNGCASWEAWNCVVPTSPAFECANGAAFNLTSNVLRPQGWMAGDQAGLSILAGLVKIAEVNAGAVNHAIRVTFESTQSSYIAPATHALGPGQDAGLIGSAYPPMGLRLRLKASVSTSGYLAASQTIMAAMKKYGLIVADVGSDWYFQGDSDDGWAVMAPDGKDTLIHEMSGDFGNLTGSDFEAVYTGPTTVWGF